MLIKKCFYISNYPNWRKLNLQSSKKIKLKKLLTLYIKINQISFFFQVKVYQKIGKNKKFGFLSLENDIDENASLKISKRKWF